MLQRRGQKEEEAQELLRQADILRRHHPGMGCRKMSRLLKQQGWGRDKVEALLLKNGYRIQYKPNKFKTTHSVRFSRYKNLMEGLKINDINRVVQTDITYYFAAGRYYYLFFLIDVYSKRIVGFEASDSMEAKGNLRALEQLIKLRGEDNLTKLIHHSDRGSQYHSTAYVQRLNSCKIKISMCRHAWENAYGERINRTIKEEYLAYWQIENLTQLKQCVAKAVKHYNEQRPHWSLNLQTPVAFEQMLKTIPMTKRKTIIIYKKEDSYPQKKSCPQNKKRSSCNL